MTAWDAIRDIQNQIDGLVDYYSTFSDKVIANYPGLHNEISDKLRTLNLNLGRFINWLDDSNYLGAAAQIILGGVAIASVSAGYYYFITEINKTRQKIEAAKQMIQSIPEEQRTEAISNWLNQNVPAPDSSTPSFSVDLGLSGLKEYIPIALGIVGLLMLYNITK